nr:MAG TPA: hypothetical protein [Caudoviricetes sp.]
MALYLNLIIYFCFGYYLTEENNTCIGIYVTTYVPSILRFAIS